MVNKKREWLLFFMIIITIPTVLADVPNYDIFISLDDKNVEPSGSIGFSIDIIGSGFCTDGRVLIIPEGKINRTTTKFYHANSTDPTKLIEKGLETIAFGDVLIDPWCRGFIDNSSAKNVNIHFEDIKLGDLNYFRAKGNLIILDDAEGGDYDLNALFSCKSEGKWYTFSSKSRIHVMYPLEKLQFFFQFLLPLIALFVGSFITFIIIYVTNRINLKHVHSKENKERIYAPLSNEFRIIHKNLESFSDMIPNEQWKLINRNLSYNLDEKLRTKIEQFHDTDLDEYRELRYKAVKKINEIISNELRKRHDGGYDDIIPDGNQLAEQLHCSFLFGKLLDKQNYNKSKLKSINLNLKEKFSDLDDFFMKMSKIIEKEEEINAIREKQNEMMKLVKEISSTLKKKLK